MTELTIAIAKGRLQTDTLDLVSRAGISISSEMLASRRLAVEDVSGRYRFIFVKPDDVPVYVEHGIADCGVVGRDVLLESEADVLQRLTLDIGSCQMVVASSQDLPLSSYGRLRVATRYPRVTAQHFGSRGLSVAIIELAGSVEVAPLLGLADCIVDLVQTGRTLRENGLRIIEVIAESTARLVINRASYQLKADAVAGLIDSLSETRPEGERRG
ncbi:MAG: ATP phosphoribosyltransferase [Acidobacteria bacterium]|nr:MAG: ATP phosphoribosyltransferase [Acidobacteriota bacterium]